MPLSVLLGGERVNDMSAEKSSSLPSHIRVWIDGHEKSPENASVSVFDRGFLYGDSIFETLRTYRGQPFALDAHMGRLEESAARVFIDLPASRERLTEEVKLAVSESGFEDCYLRVMVTRGQGALGLDPRLAVDPLRVILVAPLSPPPLADYRDGIEVVTFETSRVNDATAAQGAKLGNYLVAVLASRKARAAGAKEALIVNAAGQAVEGATSNLFWFEDDALCTVPLDAGILPGITRFHLLKVAASMGLSVFERVPKISELINSDGVFVSSSIREMLSVVRIDGQDVAGGRVPASNRALHDQFRESVGVPPLSFT